MRKVEVGRTQRQQSAPHHCSSRPSVCTSCCSSCRRACRFNVHSCCLHLHLLFTRADLGLQSSGGSPKGWVMFRPSAVTSDSSFTHSRKKTVHTRTHSASMHVLTQMVPTHPPLIFFPPFTCAPAPCRRPEHNGRVELQSRRTCRRRHFHCNRKGRLSGQNGGV